VVQVDETNDISILSVLLAFVRYIYNSEIEEEIFMSNVCVFKLVGKIFSI
jgi:hypothetical protein